MLRQAIESDREFFKRIMWVVLFWAAILLTTRYELILLDIKSLVVPDTLSLVSFPTIIPLSAAPTPANSQPTALLADQPLPAGNANTWYGTSSAWQSMTAEEQANAQLAFTMATAQPWASAAQIGCLDNLLFTESHFNTHARNPRTGAYGIPQALSANKMASAGSAWHDSAMVQLRWLLTSYIGSGQRYSTACSAWQHERVSRWY